MTAPLRDPAAPTKDSLSPFAGKLGAWQDLTTQLADGSSNWHWRAQLAPSPGRPHRRRVLLVSRCPTADVFTPRRIDRLRVPARRPTPDAVHHPSLAAWPTSIVGGCLPWRTITNFRRNPATTTSGTNATDARHRVSQPRRDGYAEWIYPASGRCRRRPSARPLRPARGSYAESPHCPRAGLATSTAKRSTMVSEIRVPARPFTSIKPVNREE